jgi:diguanylate cyclase (GGDEF)-like protein
MAERDWLTGLLNRRRLHSGLEEELARADRQGGEGSVIILDVDHFKIYNDQHGHLAGDEVLRGVAKLLQDSVEEKHVCARYGGEEFVVLLPGSDRSTAIAQAEKIRQLVENFPFEGRESQPAGVITVSLGVASFPADGTTGDAVLGRADNALYRAKANGRNRVEG